ncbi:hypothetical protein DCAR_0626068 [Daucus carota subsp. sativus]|uniref:Uncharacterized protein n=1 Tax=Daucus carota subsp. sativus TaxID=79200 RepID=A0A164WV05_DAUCS|nr:hypothetical protein DCAR_0626068 [Daucus carota subsp. sativus]
MQDESSASSSLVVGETVKSLKKQKAYEELTLLCALFSNSNVHIICKGQCSDCCILASVNKSNNIKKCFICGTKGNYKWNKVMKDYLQRTDNDQRVNHLHQIFDGKPL